MSAPATPVSVPIRVVIGIVTFRRPTQLARLLETLAAAPIPAGAAVEVVVVDNDPRAPVAELVEGVAARLALEVAYVQETRPGVSFGRNRVLERAGDADFIAFIDDDMLPAPGWLDALLEVQRTTGAAAVTGPVSPDFERPPPGWLADVFGLCYSRPRADGSVTSATAGNLLIDRRALAGEGVDFAADFSRLGGEDTQLTDDLARAGLGLAWAERARVIEHIPTSRMSRRWLWQRWFRYGLIDARIDLRRRPGLEGRLVALGRGAVRVGGGALLLLPALVAAAFGRLAAPMRRLYTLARGVGMVAGALGFTAKAYGA